MERRRGVGRVGIWYHGEERGDVNQEGVMRRKEEEENS